MSHNSITPLNTKFVQTNFYQEASISKKHEKATSNGFSISVLPKQQTNNNFLINKIKNIFGFITSKFQPSRPQHNTVSQHDNTNYLDEHRLIKGEPGDKKISPEHSNWYLHQAHLLSQAQHCDPETENRLNLAVLHAYSKAATVGEDQAHDLGIQSTPFTMQDHRYHRSTSNQLLGMVNKAYAKDIGLEEHEVIVVDSPLMSEVFERELPHPGLDTNIDTPQKFDKLIDDLLEQVKTAKRDKNEMPELPELIIDMSRLLEANQTDSKKLSHQEIKKNTESLEEKLLIKLQHFAQNNPEVSKAELSEMLRKIHLIAFAKHENQNILLLPEFALNKNPKMDPSIQEFITPNVGQKHGQLYRIINSMMIRTGYSISPDHAKAALIKLRNTHEILEEKGLPKAQLATKGSKFPQVSPGFVHFMKEPIVTKFRALSVGKNAPPYQKVLPEATFALLEGLAGFKNKNGHGMDKIYADKGLTDVLQMSYFRIQNAMNEAILRKDNLVEFNNQIELIHQEIQDILTIVQPYEDKSTLEEGVRSKLMEGPNPVLPANLEPPKVHLKASAMRGMSSIIAGVEAQKKSTTGIDQLNMVILKDTYYESDEALEHAQRHNLSVFNGDRFNEASKANLDVMTAFEKPPKVPIDLFVCEFHHNISLTRQVYTPERIAAQIKAMHEHKPSLLADHFTVAIDTTINLEQSDELRQFLADPTINELIESGRLNVALLRSAQKFDMFGMDNYYGGFTTTFNKKGSFNHFNTRMDHPDDQLGGLSFQGMSHLQKYGGPFIDAYRRGIMENTRRLYNKLPQAAIFREGTQNPMQISRIEDNRVVFLDIKFPNHAKAAEAFKVGLMKFAKNEKLPMTTRASFGFANTNFTIIEGKKFRLNPGLDDEKSLNTYAAFFHAVQDTIDAVMKEADATLPKDMPAKEREQKIDELLAMRIQNLNI